MSRRKVVGLLIETSNAYARGLLEGIISYTREHETWSIWLPEHGRGDAPPAWLAHWGGDGLIARIENAAIGRAVAATGLPVVDVSAARVIAGIPWVETDDAAIARLALDHLRERGFRHLAFCGEPRFNWSAWRWQHFHRLAREAGAAAVACPAPAGDRPLPWNQERDRLAAWLAGLPKPVGILACYDIKGQQLLEACRDAGLAVPEEVAVIGVDNDRLICELCTPPLSSVVPDVHRTGYRAAALLDRLLAGGAADGSAHLIAPLGVCARRSTDVVAVEDRILSAALRFIRERACEGINVGDVLAAVPQSRRALDRRFQEALGRTPHEEIVRVKLERAKTLLAETDLAQAAIARRAGFSSEEYLSVAFKRAVGLSPGEFRAQRPRRGG
jgi:LacI family transcriptional regulator